MGCPVELIVTLLKFALEQSGASLLLLELEERLRTFLVIDGLVVVVAVLVVTVWMTASVGSTST